MSEPIITFNNRTLRVEGDGWYLEVRVLAAGTQIAVTSNGTSDGCSDMIIRPGRTGLVFISSRASEKETENATPERPDNKVPPAARRAGRTQG